MTTGELFERHPVVALDSNVLIYLLEGSGPLADASGAVIDGIESGAAVGVMASVALTEILTRPASLRDGALFERHADELRSIDNLRIVELDAETAIDAAWGRSGGRDLGDAIHIADGAPRRRDLLRHQRRARPRPLGHRDRRLGDIVAAPRARIVESVEPIGSPVGEPLDGRR